MGRRMPREAPEWDSSLPHSGEAAGVVGIGIRKFSVALRRLV